VTKRALALVLTAALAACGSPSAPGGSSGAQDRITIATGAWDFFLSQNPAPSQCGIPNGLAGAVISSHVTLTHEGTTWIARSTTAADGDLEIRFSDTGGPTFGFSVPIEGTLKGTAIRPRTSFNDGVTFFVNPGPTSVIAVSGGNVLSSSLIPLTGNSLTGSMTITGDQGTRTCTVTGTWSLTKQLF
jgi:hypothetical protein